jgi:hypothetical protein
MRGDIGKSARRLEILMGDYLESAARTGEAALCSRTRRRSPSEGSFLGLAAVVVEWFQPCDQSDSPQ